MLGLVCCLARFSLRQSLIFGVFVSVILFLIRLLKVADFQPRIALITRTISQALTELLNFGVLFMSLLIGYAIAGILLFGHQSTAFESLSPAILNLLIMLLAWDPYSWVQVKLPPLPGA